MSPFCTAQAEMELGADNFRFAQALTQRDRYEECRIDGWRFIHSARFSLKTTRNSYGNLAQFWEITKRRH